MSSINFEINRSTYVIKFYSSTCWSALYLLASTSQMWCGFLKDELICSLGRGKLDMKEPIQFCFWSLQSHFRFSHHQWLLKCYTWRRSDLPHLSRQRLMYYTGVLQSSVCNGPFWEERICYIDWFLGCMPSLRYM